jgi:hypothetical protein
MNRQDRLSGELTLLGVQLSHVVKMMGPKISKNKDAVYAFLSAVMSTLLSCPPLSNEKINDYLSNLPFLLINKVTGEKFIPEASIQTCKEQFRQIEVDLAENESGLIYFQGNFYNGIWRAKIDYRLSDYVINLDYLNGECACVDW